MQQRKQIAAVFQVQESKSRQTAWLNLIDAITFVPAVSTIQMVLSSLFYILVNVKK